MSVNYRASLPSIRTGTEFYIAACAIADKKLFLRRRVIEQMFTGSEQLAACWPRGNRGRNTAIEAVPGLMSQPCPPSAAGPRPSVPQTPPRRVQSRCAR